MESKDQFMSGQDVFSIGKHSMDTAPLLCRLYQSPPHHARGAAAALVAALQRSPLKISQKFTETQKGKT